MSSLLYILSAICYLFHVQGTEYILKGASYNSEIAPNESVRFGYILSGEAFKYPQNIFNCAKRVDITDNYDVYYNIVGANAAYGHDSWAISSVSDYPMLIITSNPVDADSNNDVIVDKYDMN